MTLRLTAYVAIIAMATLAGCHLYYPHSYVSLEGFPDVNVLMTREVDDWWAGLGVIAPVEYLIVRDAYELRIHIDEYASQPTAFVEVHSARPGIRLLPDRRWDDGCLHGNPAASWEGNPDRKLKFWGWCDGSRQRLGMKFHVLDAKGRIAEESIPYRINEGGLRAHFDSI